MILLTKLNDVQFALNCDMIETIKESPDTTIRLFNKNIYIVKESMREVMDKIVEFRKSIYGSGNYFPLGQLAGDETEE